MTTTRTLRILAIDNIAIEGLTRGPASGWALVGNALTNPYGGRFELTPAAAARVRDAASTAKPSSMRKLTGYQITQLPEAEAEEFRANCEYLGTRHGVHGLYGVYTPAVPAVITLDRTDLA